MIYLNSNVINKIGNSNRLYYNGDIVYQGYTTGGGSTGDYSLPDVPFMFNYNARDYVDGVIPNADGALFDENLVLVNQQNITKNGDYITINNNCAYTKLFNSTTNNPFNRTSTNSTLTLIAKAKTDKSDGYQYILGNRSDTSICNGEGIYIGRNGGSYAYMFIWGIDNAWLHTKHTSETTCISVPIDYTQPNIIGIRCLEGDRGYAQNYTTNVTTEIKNTGFQNQSSRIQILGGSFPNEIFLGDFYWVYCSLEQLTDEQIQQVIEYNENKAFEPVVPPVEPEPDEPETPEIPEGIVSLQYCWDNSIFNIPFRDCYIDMNNVEDDLPTNYFICLSKTPDTQNASTTTYSICPKENSIFDTGNSAGWRMYIMEGFYNSVYNGTPVVATPLGNGIYYYQFSTPVYLSYKANEANAPFWRVNVIPINN